MKKIDKNGVYQLSMEQYHGDCCAGPSISSSGLRTIFFKSPAHYWNDSYLNPARAEQKDSAAFVLGRAAHHLLLGEQAFSTLFVVRPEKWDSWRTDAAKDWKAGHEAQGRTVLVPSQIEQIRGMARSLSENSLVKAGILNGQIEQSLIFKDKKTGIYCKSRPDAVPTDGGDFSDLKTTAEVGFGLDNAVERYGYDLQAGLTKWAAKEVLGVEMASFSFVFVESSPPYCTEVLTLHNEDVARAELDLRASLETFAWCLQTKNWFGPGGSQNDGRYVVVTDRTKERRTIRREFLAREIAAAAAG